jgi:hypothetical protein
MSTKLPAEFADLEPFASKWAQPTEYERAAERRRSSPTELKAFYDAILSRLPDILAAVDRYPLGEVAGQELPLYYMALSLAEIAPHVEFYNLDPRVPFAFREERMLGRHCDIPG